ncbi:helix-turn-helix domain-containing protein [Planktothrix pseudagardhii]|jgi:transcriptional regulator with XRE-family HTH domain|uniref:Helix-turn-helix domain protein n=1 Tax=Planktothrix pseudagardhii TaxID=132604 RepID=A0A9W4G9M1_9CYAN|nr:helix-turn-helix domain-containing protein [Planktothrix pseudagardhii]CAD5982601.1 Helix-turn-helix domain protein [Planktothrix pseudagardhii]
MSESALPDYNPQLQELMQRAGISSLEELSQIAGVSPLQIIRLRRGLALQTPVSILLKISQGLKISLSELLAVFAPGSVPSETPIRGDLESEYQRLQTQMEQQRSALLEEWKRESLHVLESWLLQWPTVVYRVQENPQLPAVKLLPFVRPVEQLMRQWGVDAIAPVGTQVPYDPHLHQLLEGTAQPGEQVIVRYTGYREGNKLLYRAKVSPVKG